MARILKLSVVATLALHGTATAARDTCFVGPFGPYGSQVPAYVLMTLPPEFSATERANAPFHAKKGLMIAVQTIVMKPRLRYLTADVSVTDEKDKSLGTAVPLTAGSPISLWKGADGERHCSIGWKTGLFGGAAGDGHYRWICFEDRNGNGSYDTAWRPKTANLGLSYSKNERPLLPEAVWTETPPAKQSDTIFGAAPQPLKRQIEVKALSGKEIRLSYWGVGIDRKNPDNDRRIVLDRPQKVEMGGIVIDITPQPSGPPLISATGDFAPLPVTPICDGTTYRIGNFDAQMVFSFPNW